MDESGEFSEFWNDEDIYDEDANPFALPDELTLDPSILEAYLDSLDPEPDYL